MQRNRIYCFVFAAGRAFWPGESYRPVQRGLRRRAFVVTAFYSSLDMYLPAGKLQGIVSQRIGWKPIFSVNHLSIRREFGEEVVPASAPLLLAVNVRRRLAGHPDDLQIAVVHPDSSLEVAFVLFDLPRRNVKHVAVQ